MNPGQQDMAQAQYDSRIGSRGIGASPVPPNNLVSGISRVEELEKRLQDLLARVTRIGTATGAQHSNKAGERADVDPPRPEVLTFRLFDTARRNHILVAQIDEEVAKLEIAILG